MYDYRPAVVPADLATIMAALEPEDAEMVQGAFQFAAAAHAGQFRDEGVPFIEHPAAVAVIVWRELGLRDVDVLMAALTHDVLEDCPELTREALAAATSPRTLDIVEDVTKPRVPDADKPSRDRAYLDRLRSLPEESRRLKLADRIHNLRTVVLAGEPAKARRYLDVSRQEFIPLALMTDPVAVELISQACEAIERHLGLTGDSGVAQ